jgi:hypothetical protein
VALSPFVRTLASGAVVPADGLVETYDFATRGRNGLLLVHNITAVAVSASVVIGIWGKDEASGQFYLLLTSAAQTTVSTLVLQVHPYMDAVAGLVASGQLPAAVRVVVTHAAGNSYTRTLGLQLTSAA